MARTMRQGFTPMPRNVEAILPGRRTAGVGVRDALHSRTVGRTRLEVYAAEVGHGRNGTTLVRTGYSVVAVGNVSRESRTLARDLSYEQALSYVECYSPKWGLLK